MRFCTHFPKHGPSKRSKGWTVHPSGEFIDSIEMHTAVFILHNLWKWQPCETPTFHKANSVTHLCGPELHQYSLPLSLLISSFLLQEPPVGVKPKAWPRVLRQTCWLQKFPQLLLSALSCSLLFCQVDKQSIVCLNADQWNLRHACSSECLRGGEDH